LNKQFKGEVMSDFVGFQKIARLSREMVITEKIDGTNGCIFIGDDGEFLVGSRTRWITPESDNHGFARWAYGHIDELMVGLGPGRHFGEWWGSGIQRGYGLPKGEKRFSLFNVHRWCEYGSQPQRINSPDSRTEKYQDVLPECCLLVPVLYRGNFDTDEIVYQLETLAQQGSYAAPGFFNPEGIVIYHTAANTMFKKTIKNDEKGKGE